MDFNNLFKILPTLPENWTISEVSTFLKFLSLDSYISMFVDGLLLLGLNENELQNDLQMSESLNRKKFLMWTKERLKNYQQFILRKNQDFEIENSLGVLMDISNGATLETNNYFVEKIPIIQFHILQKIFQFSSEEKCYLFGNNNNCNFLIENEELGKISAEVIYNENFFIRDLGSVNGTFLRIIKPMKLCIGKSFSLGNAEFIIKNITISKINGLEEGYIHVEGMSEFQNYKFYLQTNPFLKRFIFGTNPNRCHCVINNENIVDCHAYIEFLNSCFFLTDLNSNTGTWERLSLENKSSKYYELENNSYLRIGKFYKFYIVATFFEKNINVKLCIVCRKNGANIMHYPCKDMILCVDCFRIFNYKNCQLCKTPIESSMKRY